MCTLENMEHAYVYVTCTVVTKCRVACTACILGWIVPLPRGFLVRHAPPEIFWKVHSFRCRFLQFGRVFKGNFHIYIGANSLKKFNFNWKIKLHCDVLQINWLFEDVMVQKIKVHCHVLQSDVRICTRISDLYEIISCVFFQDRLNIKVPYGYIHLNNMSFI